MIVLASTPSLHKRLMCALANDLVTVTHNCPRTGWRSDNANACRPGCPNNNGPVKWCHDTGANRYYCAYTALEVASMLEEQTYETGSRFYNEVRPSQ